ncbi:MAG: tryptophan-rich sensory protein [bacterium]
MSNENTALEDGQVEAASAEARQERTDLIRQIVTLVLIVIGTVAANLLGMSVQGTETGEIANQSFQDSVFFFPAGYVFVTIWPVIYLGIVGLAIHQVLPSQRNNPRYRRGDYMLAVNLLLNAVWVLVFGLQLFVWSFVLIIPILVTAILAYKWLGVCLTPPAPQPYPTPWERFFKGAVSIYVAWLTIATVASASTALVAADWNGFGIGMESWGVIISIVGIVLGAVLLWVFRDPLFAVVYAYAYLGIMVRRLGEVPGVAITAAVGAGIFVVLFVLSLILWRGQGREARA